MKIFEVDQQNIVSFVMQDRMMQSHIPVATVQEADNETGQVATDCLHVSVILRAIFQHFSTAELLQLALVSKFWSYEARSLLRDRGSVALSTSTTPKLRACEDLGALASALRQSKAITRVHPFSGLIVDLNGLFGGHTYWCEESSTGERDQVCEDILGQIKCRSLSVKFDEQWTDEVTNCSGFLLVKKLLEKFASVLEQLTLEFRHQREAALPQVIRSCSFPSLLTLRINHSGVAVDSYTNWTKTIVSHAPNLKFLETSNRLNLNENVLEGSSTVHITSHPYSVFLNEIPENLVGTFRLTRMDEAKVRNALDFELDRFNRITSGLLAVSRSTLSSMSIDVVFLVPLTAYGICLENVRTLKIDLDEIETEVYHPPHQDLWRLAKSFDFTRIFPNLKDITLNGYSEFPYTMNGIHEMVERAMASFVEPMPDRAVNIKNLSLENSSSIDHSGVPLYAEMFPDVHVLSIEGFEIPIGRIWEYWPHLKALDLSDGPVVIQNLDSVLCGIFPEEVAQLQDRDEEYLRSVNIVPVRPSITCLKDLKTLNFSFGESSEGPFNDPTYLFSKVTGLIALQRCPALTVTLTTEDERRQEALSHLRPYATILLKATV